MMKQFLVASALVVAASANAVEVPNVFQAGTAAKAAEVNENFSTLKDAINALENSNAQAGNYSAQDFLPTSDMFKVFTFVNKVDPSGNPLEEKVLITVNADKTEYRYIEDLGYIDTSGVSSSKTYRRLDFVLDSNGFFFKGRHQIREAEFTDGTFPVDINAIFDPGIMRFPSIFSVGQQFGGDSEITADTDGFSKNNIINSATIYKGSIFEIVDVTVPAGSFHGCLKVLQENVSNMTTRYFCPNIGVVKVVSQSRINTQRTISTGWNGETATDWYATTSTSIKVLAAFDTNAFVQEAISEIPDFVMD